MTNELESRNIVGISENHLNFDYQDLERCERVARFLAEELKSGPAFGFDDSLELIAGEIADLPGIISDVKKASQAFDHLDRILNWMFALADRASEEHGPPADTADSIEETAKAEQRQTFLNEEFIRLATVVAQLAGREDYRGPVLSLKTPAQARAAKTVLGYLRQARLNFARKLKAQRRLINEAVRETVNTLGQIAAKPGADPANKLTSLLVKIDLNEPGLAGFNQHFTRH